jgi:UDP-2,3-diacylglucosamine pyrophosphatase LpxH
MSLTPTEPTLILSDLHLGHRSCLIRNPEQLAPLLRNTGTVIFNGDTAEMRVEADRVIGRRMAAELAHVCHQVGTKALFVNGNHDPTISNINHVELAEGVVLITHGDILFLGVAPWSKDAIHYLNAHRKILKDLKPETLSDLEHQLRATKQASLALQQLEDSATKGTGRKFGLFVRQLWPPSRPFKIMKAWLELPDRSANLAAVYRPEARFVVVGHTHYPGIWRRAGRIIINTGSFVPYLPAHGVILESGRLEVRKVDRTHEGFTLGKAIDRWAIDRV